MTHIKIPIINGYVRTPLGGFLNHTETPNCCLIELLDWDDYRIYHLHTIRHINEGDELTLNYHVDEEKQEAPNHGVTGLSISQEEVDLFLDYLVESEPEQAKVHENAKETANTDIRDAEIHYIDAKEDRLYRILNKIAVSANKYFNCHDKWHRNGPNYPL